MARSRRGAAWHPSAGVLVHLIVLYGSEFGGMLRLSKSRGSGSNRALISICEEPRFPVLPCCSFRTPRDYFCVANTENGIHCCVLKLAIGGEAFAGDALREFRQPPGNGNENLRQLPKRYLKPYRSRKDSPVSKSDLRDPVAMHRRFRHGLSG
ncbi:MAG: hypothetical protein ACI9R3_006037 [Verrucomicrobiales bacterium]|jgi:hypothetical protein